MTTRPRRFLAPVLLALILVFSASCGRKTEPLTPASPRPESVKDVKAVARDGVAFLSWAIPTKNVEGKDMNQAEILGFRIFRADVGGDRKKPRYKQFATVDLANPAPAEVKNGRVVWADRTVRYGQAYGYRVRAVSAHGGLSEPSEEARVVPLLSLAPPKNLSAVGGDTHTTLTWDPVTTRSDGSAYGGFVGYNIYRGGQKGREGEAPINNEPVRTQTYRDTAVVNGQIYYYIVRAVDSPAQPWKESLDSPEASATPIDLTPPAAPKGLTVVPGVGRVFLTWNENKESDLAGYNVYRSKKSGRQYEKLTDKPINRTTFSDDTVKPGSTYYYVVSAVDRSGNESGFSKEMKAYSEKVR